LKVDDKGRILIPKEIRSLLNIENIVSAHADNGKLWSRTSKPLFNNAITSIFSHQLLFLVSVSPP